MASRRNNHEARRNATANRRPREEVVEKFHHALRHAVDKYGRNITETARALRVSRSTLTLWLSGERHVDAMQIAGFVPVWRHFLRCLVILERKARVI